MFSTECTTCMHMTIRPSILCNPALVTSRSAQLLSPLPPQGQWEQMCCPLTVIRALGEGSASGRSCSAQCTVTGALCFNTAQGSDCLKSAPPPPPFLPSPSPTTTLPCLHSLSPWEPYATRCCRLCWLADLGSESEWV